MPVRPARLTRKLLTFFATGALVMGVAAVRAVVTGGVAAATDAPGPVHHRHRNARRRPLPTPMPPGHRSAPTTRSNRRRKAISCASATLCVAIGGNAGGYLGHRGLRRLVVGRSAARRGRRSGADLGLLRPGHQPHPVRDRRRGRRPRSSGERRRPAIFLLLHQRHHRGRPSPSPGAISGTSRTSLCPSATRCVAVGTDNAEGAPPISSRPTGVVAGALTWNVDTAASGLGANPGFPDSLSCASATLRSGHLCRHQTAPNFSRWAWGPGPLVWQIGTLHRPR